MTIRIKFLLPLIVFVLLCIFIKAETDLTVVDSLEMKLKNTSGEEKFDVLIALSKELQDI